MQWTNQSKAHNTILVDGQGMPTFSPKPTGQIESCQQNGDIFTAKLDLSDAYESLQSWHRCFTMDASARTLLIEDTVESEDAHVLDWLLHSLSQPAAENGVVTLVRKGVRLTIEPVEGLQAHVQITDEFETDLNAGIPEDQPKVEAPKQFHMKWKTEKAKLHKIVVKLTITAEKS